MTSFPEAKRSATTARAFLLRLCQFAKECYFITDFQISDIALATVTDKETGTRYNVQVSKINDKGYAPAPNPNLTR